MYSLVYHGCIASLYTRVGRPLYVPPCVYAPPIPPCVYAPLYHPGYTSVQHGEPGHATRQPRCDRCTALTLSVAERTVSVGPLTVLPPVSLLVIVERGTPMRRVLSLFPYNTAGKRHLGAELLPLLHHPFHCWRCFSGCVFLSVLSIM